MNHATLIKLLDGPHALHAKLAKRGVAPTKVAVRAWALEGRAIPAKYWMDVIAIAQAEDIAVTYADLARHVAKDAAA